MPDGPGRFTQDSSCPALLRCRPAAIRFGYGALTLCGRPFHAVPLASRLPCAGPTTPGAPRRTRFGLLPVRSPLLGELTFCSLFLRVLRCFSSPRSPPSIGRVTGLQPAGLPHSDIRGSQGACPSPRLFAACRVLLRLREPRYPPSALISFPFRAPGQSRRASRTVFSFPSIMSKIFHLTWRIRDSNP